MKKVLQEKNRGNARRRGRNARKKLIRGELAKHFGIRIDELMEDR